MALAAVCLISCSKVMSDQNEMRLQKSLLLFYDADKNGILDEEETLNVTEIHICCLPDYKPLNSLKNYQNLEILWATACRFTSLDVTQNLKLRELHCWQNNLKTLYLTNNMELEKLSCSEGKIETINLGYSPNLTLLSCYENKLTSLDISSYENLNILICNDNLLTKLDVSNNPQLQVLYCYSNPNLATLYMKKGQTIQQLVKDDHTTIVYLP